MIQRVQTLYLLLATIAMSLTLFMPLATIWQADQELIVKAFAINGPVGFQAPLPLYLGIVLTVATALPLVTIFLYKKRMVQIRLCVSEIIILIGAIIFMALYCYRLCDLFSEIMEQLNFTLGFSMLMPVVALILILLAIRGVVRDEALVRSLDRIR